jgi:hypothetical protein
MLLVKEIKTWEVVPVSNVPTKVCNNPLVGSDVQKDIHMHTHTYTHSCTERERARESEREHLVIIKAYIFISSYTEYSII